MAAKGADGGALTLEQALTLAVPQNRELTIAGLDVERAQQRMEAARTLLLTTA